MTAAEVAATLVHDVGKYVARIAKNVAEDGPVVPALVPLLVKDLYELPSGGRASERFRELAAPLARHDAAVAPELDAVRGLLSEIDALEPRVRDAEPEACLLACSNAREVERRLRELARRVSGG